MADRRALSGGSTRRGCGRRRTAPRVRPWMAVVALLMLAGCAPDAGTGAGGVPEEPVGTPVQAASPSPIDWLLDGPGAEALAGVPGSSWTPQAAVEVAAACSPVDAHEGWRLTGTVVEPGDVAADFDGGDGFEAAPTGGSWDHVGDRRLRLVERDDGGVDFELFVPVGDAPAWETVDRIDVEVVFGPERCG